MISKRRTRRVATGFTLIELLVVVIIIALLAAMAVPNYVKTQDKAKESAVKSNMHTVQLSAESYAVESGGVYGKVADFSPYLPGGSSSGIVNPFTAATKAVEEANSPSGKGMVSYDIVGSGYEIRGGAADGTPVTGTGGVTLVLQNL